MHILIVNQFHRQPGRGGSARLNDLARLWTAAGHKVTVVTSKVDHQTGKVPDEYRGKWKRVEQSDGADVHRVWTFPGSPARSMLRIARDFSFAAASTLTGLRLKSKPDVVLASSPPLFPGLTGVALARRFKVPVMFEARDLWPDYAVEIGALSGAPAKIAYRMESYIYSKSAAVTTVTEAFARRIHEKGVPKAQIHVIPNGADLTTFGPGEPDATLREQLGWTGRFVVLYAGVLGPSQALGQLIEAAAKLRDDQRLLFVLAGDGQARDALETDVQDRGLTNVRFLGQVTRDDVPQLLRSADVAAITLRKLPLFEETIPAKLFEAMGCARPVVLAAPGVSAEIVRKAEAGITVAAEDPDEFAQAIMELAGDPALCMKLGRNGHNYVKEHFNREKLAMEYLNILENLVATGQRREG